MPLRCPKAEAKIGHHVNQIDHSPCVKSLEQSYHLALADIVDLLESGRISDAERLIAVERVSIAMNTWRSRVECAQLMAHDPRRSDPPRLSSESWTPASEAIRAFRIRAQAPLSESDHMVCLDLPLC